MNNYKCLLVLRCSNLEGKLGCPDYGNITTLNINVTNTIPASGYISGRFGGAGGTRYYVYINNKSVTGGFVSQSNNSLPFFLPVNKGDIVKVDGLDANYAEVKFIPYK